MAVAIVGIGMLILGVCLGVILGAGIVVGRIRDYRDTRSADACKPCVGDLLDYLGV